MWDVYRCEVVEFDTLVDAHGCDLLRDDMFADLMGLCRAGELFSVIIGTAMQHVQCGAHPEEWGVRWWAAAATGH